MPDISFDSPIDIYSDENEYVEILEKEKIFNEIKSKPLSNFSFELNININNNILKIINKNEDYIFKLKEFNIYLKVSNIKKNIKVSIRKPPQFINFNGFNSLISGIPICKYNSDEKTWEKIKVNTKYDESLLYVNMFGIAHYFEINYRDNNVTLININPNLNKFISLEYARKDYRFHHFIKFKTYNEKYTIEINNDSNNAFIMGIYNNKYWYPLFIDYPEELDNYKILEFSKDNDDLAEDLINQIEKIKKKDNSFLFMAKIIFTIKTLQIQNKNDNLKELLNELLTHLPNNSIDIQGFQDLLEEINLNEENINLKLYNTVIILYILFKKRFNEIKDNEYKIYLNYPNNFISGEEIQLKIKELKNNYFKIDKNEILRQNNIKTLFPLLKEIPLDSKLNNSFPKNPLDAFKKKEKHDFFEANLDKDHEYIKISEFDEMINKEKMESIKANIIIKEINYPDTYNLIKLINFYNNCINTIRELPLFIVNSLNNKNNLKIAEQIYLKLLIVYNGIQKDDESLFCHLIKSFSDSFEKMTNNLIKSKVDLKDLLPSKFKIKINEQNDKEYIKIPKKNIIELIQFLSWNINKKENDYRFSAIKKSEDIMTEFSISTDTLDKSLNDLETKKLQYNNLKRETENLHGLEEGKNKKISNNPEIEIKFKKDKEDENCREKKEKIKYQEYALILDDDDFDKKENDEMIQEKEKENENNNIQRQKQIQLNKSIQNKEYKQVDLSKFNFNPLIIIKLVINRMEEIDKIVDKNKKPSLQLKYDFNLPNIPEENFNDFKELKVKKLYNLGINFCSKLMKNICEKDIPFADQAAYILFDCSGFINIKNKLKMFLIICGLTNALNIVNIPYTLILIGDSEDYFKNKKRKEKGIYYFNNDDKYE